MKYYKIDERTLMQLLHSEEELNQLECYGVDNWNGYGAWYQDDPDYNASKIVDSRINDFEEI